MTQVQIKIKERGQDIGERFLAHYSISFQTVLERKHARDTVHVWKMVHVHVIPILVEMMRATMIPKIATASQKITLLQRD